MTLKHIRIELARDEEFPNGSRTRGYEFVAPLDGTGHLDAAEWKAARERCRVKRFWEGAKPEIGRLVHRRGGTWAFDYDPRSSDDDEPGFKLDKHRFVPGEYVSFREHDGVMRTFRIVAVAELE
ncbi:MAG: hypothetical protein SFX73_04875 [Kofleriaceae bacterium]|nr:hypothetical protein [Kofleriaceae bacterium]